MANEKENADSKHSVRHILFSILGIVLCVLLIPILIINLTLLLHGYLDSDSLPSFAGYAPLVVLTDSMVPEFESGDLVIIRTEDPEAVQVGDVIAFWDPASSGDSLVSHRVVNIVNDNGSLSFQTKGDANNIEDQELVPAENLVGQECKVIPGAGNFILFLQTPKGILLFVVCPLLLLLIYDRIRHRRLIKKMQNAQMD